MTALAIHSTGAIDMNIYRFDIDVLYSRQWTGA